jgi:transposase
MGARSAGNPHAACDVEGAGTVAGPGCLGLAGAPALDPTWERPRVKAPRPTRPTVPILTKGKTETGRVWTYVRDDRPFGGQDPPAGLITPRATAPANIQSGISRASPASCRPTPMAATIGSISLIANQAPIVEALCWSHSRRKFFELADIAANARRGRDASPISPIALEAVRRIDAVFDIEREINGFSAEDRLAARRLRIAPLIAALEEWMRAERAKLSRHNAVAKAIDYMLTRWPAFTRFLEDGPICLTNNAAERALRGLALGRKSWLFAGSERGAPPRYG